LAPLSLPAALPISPAHASGLRELADAGGKWAAEPFAGAIGDFYLTNPIARASRIMAEMSKLRAKMHSLVAAE
jgi:NADH-quinone oxidoreductase subunit G